ncbi:21784_t:CDS:10 [Entrophospora sp. SA101]|nr:21784_t:CDS:10 [Entrophospora sp. SA101]
MSSLSTENSKIDILSPTLNKNSKDKEIVLKPNTKKIQLYVFWFWYLKNYIRRHHPGHFRDDPVGFMMEMGAFYQGTGWRSYKNYIGARILYDGYTEEVKERILNSERELQDVADKMVDKLVADLNSLRFIRLFGFCINNILVRMYHQGVHISEREFLEVRRVAILAAENSQSLIILPSHKSHIDYLVISYIFFRLGLALPHIAAGDNLDIPVVGGILRSGGAFFIRRSWGEDQLYGSVVKEYVEGLLERGHNIECFIEGTRSRTGKLLPPKLGILKIILDCILSGRAKDCWIVPMSIQYDKVIETESYVNELLGNPKERESLWGIMTNTRLLQLKWGRIDVRFTKPYSLTNFINEQIERRKSFNLQTESQKIILLQALGYQLNSVSVVMPTALVGTVILTLRGRGVGRIELIRRVNWLKAAVLAKGGRVADFGGKTTVNVLKDLIKERKDLLEPIFYAEKRFELSFYPIVSAAMYTKIKQGGAKSTQRLHRSLLLREVSFLSQLLKVEFVYDPEGYVELTEAERAIGRENYDFYCFLIWPFIETYWLAAVSLFSMTPTSNPSQETSITTDTRTTASITWFNESDFHNKCQIFGKTLYYQGDLSYFESINKETLKNAFIKLEDEDIIRVKRSRNTKIMTTVALHPDYVPTRNKEGAIEPKGNLWDLVERIGKFRREGKNRRDNATVSSRVLSLVEKVGTPSTADVAVMAPIMNLNPTMADPRDTNQTGSHSLLAKLSGPDALDTLIEYITLTQDTKGVFDILSSYYIGTPSKIKYMKQLYDLYVKDETDPQNIMHEVLKEIVIENYDNEKMDNALKNDSEDLNPVLKLIDKPFWRKTIYDLSDKYPDSYFLNSVIQRIADKGYTDEIKNLKSASAYVSVYSKVILNQFKILLLKDDDASLNVEIPELMKTVSLNPHTYIFVQALIKRIIQSMNGYAFRRIYKELEKGITRVINKDHVHILRTLVMAPPAQISSAIAKIPLTPGDVVALHKSYSSPNPPPPVFLRDPQLLYFILNAIYVPSEQNKNFKQDLKEKYLYLAAFAASAKDLPDGTIDTSKVNDTLITLKKLETTVTRRGVTGVEFNSVVKDFLEYMDKPVASMGIIFWIRHVLRDTSFYEKHFKQNEVPVPHLILEEIAYRHSYQRNHIFNAFKGDLELDSLKVTPEMMFLIRQQLLDRFLYLVQLGFVMQVLQYMESMIKGLDERLLFYFVRKLIQMSGPPYNDQFYGSVLRLLEPVSVLMESKLETRPLLKQFISKTSISLSF